MPYVYLIHCRASVNIKENVYKFGKTTDFSKRLSGYDKGTIPLFLLYINDCDTFETEILDLLSKNFTKRSDYGSEYFEGDLSKMIEVIMIQYSQIYNPKEESRKVRKVSKEKFKIDTVEDKIK